MAGGDALAQLLASHTKASGGGFRRKRTTLNEYFRAEGPVLSPVSSGVAYTEVC